jgi:hypothetical protein
MSRWGRFELYLTEFYLSDISEKPCLNYLSAERHLHERDLSWFRVRAANALMNPETLMKLPVLLLLTLLVPLVSVAEDTTPNIDAVGKVIDDFHDAAAHGDKARYFGHMTDDAVYLGTDEWERWPKYPVFSDYVDGRFKDGTGWTYQSVERTVAFNEREDVAWFDEVLFSETNGRIRGTGVLTLSSGQWKIEHYAMSFLIFNENWDEVIELTKKTRELKESASSQ